VANIFFCTAFTVLAMTGLYRAFQSSWTATMPYALILLAFPVAYYVAHPEISFRQPIDPALVIFASFAVLSRQKPLLNLASPGKKSDSHSRLP
jgi:hypothetical protein